ncbi:MAG: VWA domain-containing protein, partial [Firmicutes bacterium]|nr:VWA domain-containing protein [Bacillota bacterium]
MKKILTFLLIIVFALGLMSAGVLADDRTVDPSTLDRWENWFGEGVETSENAGGVWLDKTVQTDASYYNKAATKNETKLSMEGDNFLVSLSAIGNNKSIMGYTYNPTDTFLILDVSGSMNHDRITTLVAAANDAMKRLLELNNYNRVGVVLYSNTSTLLLPPDHYSHKNNTFLVYTAADSNGRRYVKVNSEVKDSAGNTMERKQRRGDNGSTYIQGALDMAYNEFAKLDIKIPDGEDFMAGMARTPIIVLMSDGAPTLASQHYDDLGASTFGNGSNSTNENSFVTQLTAADVRYKLDAHYQSTTPLFYTLGLNVENNSHAVSVMDPERTNSSINSYWNTFMAGRRVNLSGTNLSLTKASDSNITDASQKLYVDRYFPAADKDDMLDAFNAIVDQIIIQSRYFATDVDGDANFDGYVTFIDDIGNYMEVKAMKGMVYGKTYYDGSCLAKNFVSDSGGTDAFGTNANPTPLGNEFIRAVKERLGISDTATAQNLVDTAYHYGQLYYNSPTDFGNRISIYADENMKYLGFYNKGSNFPVPSGAEYIVDTYGFIDSTIAENSDDYQVLQGRLLYISVAVRTEISTGHVSVVWQIPATMLPMITRDFSIEGKDLSNPGEITMTDNLDSVFPLRLVYEVGLRDEINAFNVSDIVKTDSEGNSVKIHNGVYSFYTNKWKEGVVNMPADPNAAETYHPSQDVNTVAYFQPGEKNERYYYADSTIVYEKCNQGDTGAVAAEKGQYFKPYTGNTPPSGDSFYRLIGIFDWNNTNNIKYELHPEKIMTNALKEAEKSDDKWIIPAGTPRGRDSGGNGTLIVNKAENKTESLPYSHYGSYEYFRNADDNNETLFIADCIMGNNGVQTLTSAQGIAISKTVDVVPSGVGHPQFTYTITADRDVTVSATLLSGGQYSNSGNIEFKQNVGQEVTLGVNETLYLTGMDSGVKFTVVETDTNQDDYDFASVKINGTVSNSNNAEVTVEDNSLQKLEYYNTLDVTGELVINKKVKFHEGDIYEIPDNLEFTFDVELSGYAEGNKVNTTDGEKIVNDKGEISVVVPANGTVIIFDLKDNTVATVTEQEKNGFKSDLTGNNNSVIIDSGASQTITVTNTYEPILPDPDKDPKTPLLTWTGKKEMKGRDLLDTDEFKVAFGYHGSSSGSSTDHDHGIAVTQLEVATLNKANNWKYDFSAKLNEHLAQEVTEHGLGVYTYHIHEVTPADADKIPGVVYDPIVNDVEIHVTDTNLDGYYEVELVPYRNAKADGLNITANVINTYAPAGYVTAEFFIEKELENLTDEDISLAGFRFGLFEKGKTEPLYILVSDEHGGDSLYLNYTPEDIGTHEYVLKELIPVKGSADYKPRMVYDDTAYAITVEVYDKLDSTLGVKIYETDLGSANASDSFMGVFTNIYE